MRLRSRLFSAAAAALIATCALGSTPALAAPASLDEARSQLESLGSQLSSLQNDLAVAGDQLEDTKSQIADVEAQIQTKTQELGQAQQTLAQRTRSSYKQGATRFLDTLLGSTSFEDLVSRVYYMDKVSDADAKAINDVKDIKADLDARNTELQASKNTQEQAVSDMQSQVDAFQEKVSEAQAVYNSLDAQQQAELAAEAEANAGQVNENGVATNALTAAVQTSQAANAGQVSSGTVAAGSHATTNGTSGSSSSPSRPSSNGGSNTSTNTNSANSNTSGGTNGGSTTTPSAPTVQVPTVDTSSGDPVAIARQFVGKVPYVYGGSSPQGFDCSGLVNYCFSKCGISVGGRTTGAIESYLRSKGAWKTSMSELKYGDIVFTSSGHVGIYAGGGMMVDAPKPGMTVSYRAVYAFYGGGDPR